MVLATASAAIGASLSFTETDPPADAPMPESDLQSASMSFDPATATLTGAVTLGAAPAFPGLLGIAYAPGRFTKLPPTCVNAVDATTWTPGPGDVGTGRTQPYTEVFSALGVNPIGDLPTTTSGNATSFTSVGASSAVAERLGRLKLNCASVFTRTFANPERDADKIVDIPLVSGPRPECQLRSQRVRAGSPIKFVCTNVRGSVTINRDAGARKFFHTKQKIKGGGQLRLPTSQSMRGTWRITVWKGKLLIARFDRVKIA